MTNAWRLDTDNDTFATLTFDTPDARVNTFSAGALAQLDETLDQLAIDCQASALIIRSGKKDSFIVGADLAELAAIDNEADARAKAEAGQAVFDKLTQLSMPTIALIHGSCMGGGLEMALACDYRIASDHPKTSIGLPEVSLGLLPGWGGTQRLPRLIGLAQAMPMILSGKPVKARKALKLGLVDALAAEEFLEEKANSFAQTILQSQGARDVIRKRRSKQPRLMRLLASTPPTRAILFRSAAKTVRRRAGGHYPAPVEAIEVLRSTYGKPIRQGLRIEADALARLVCSPICRNLIRLFHLNQSLKKAGRAKSQADQPSFRAVGVVGAGAMGGGIAWALAAAGAQVRLKDITWDAVALGTASAASMFRASLKRRKIKPDQMNVAMHRIAGAIEYTGFAHLDVVIEAVVENLDIKKSVLREIESHVGPDTLICTNTSSLPIEELAKALKRPQRFVGMHFFNPVNRMQLVEIVPAKKTSDKAAADAVALARLIGKTPIVVGACAGFLVNRILLPYIVESAALVEEGVSADRIDNLLKQFGMPMGPLALADEVGLDVGYKVAKVLEEAYGPRMRVPDGFRRIVESGELLGKKNGHGFYIHSKGHMTPNPDAARLALNGRSNSQEHAASITDDDIIDRAILAMVNEAARCIDEGVTSDADQLDAAMVFGTGFAPFRGGLLRYADDRGVSDIVNRLRALSQRCGERFEPAPLLVRLASSGGRLLDRSDQS